MTTTAVNHKILHDFPFPIAKAYEGLLKVRSASERCDQSRFLFEATLRFCASIAIADFLANKQPDATMQDSFLALQRPSLGHWAKLLRQCLENNDQPILSGLLNSLSKKTETRPFMIDAIRHIRTLSDGRPRVPQKAASPMAFIDAMIMYRNRTAGHGAPQPDHTETFAPILVKGVLDFIEQLSDLTTVDLTYISEIKVERGRFIHSLVNLRGTTQIPLPDYVTDQTHAQLESDRTLVLLDPNNRHPILSLHPFLIYRKRDVYLLDSCDFQRSVRYICYHTGASYSADNTYADFRQRLGPAIASVNADQDALRAEETYLACLRTSLADGIISKDEREVLDDMAQRLGIPQDRLAELESNLLSASPALERSNPPHVTDVPNETDKGFQNDNESETPFSPTLIDQHWQLLMELGKIVMVSLVGRADPTLPLPLHNLAQLIENTAPGQFGHLTLPQLARLIADAQNHGFTPGLQKTTAGFSVAEDHIAFKLNHQQELKANLGKHAASLIESNMSVGLDGGSTTLPIAQALSLALDSDMLWNINVVTNSLSVAEVFANLMVRRGWSDEDSPVTLLLCAGQLRASTNAIANPKGEGNITADSMTRILNHLDGLDFCFVGANGISSEGAITIPTPNELPTKRQLIEAARSPYITADITKFGVTHKTLLARWDETLNVLTNQPPEGSPAVEAVLQRKRNVEIQFCGDFI